MVSRDQANMAGGAPAQARAATAAAPFPESSTLDAHAVFAAIGEVAYEWRIATDALVWGSNLHSVLAGIDPVALACGKSYARLIEPQSGASRADVVTGGGLRDDGLCAAAWRSAPVYRWRARCAGCLGG